MAQEVIFAEQTLNGFALKADFGLYAYDIAPAPFSLVLGESYIVVWDGETFTCEAQDMSAIIEGGLALGNLASVGGAGNNEPFIIGWTQYGVTIFAIDNESAHSMAIYQDAGESYAPNDAVILSYSKSPVHYENVPKVWLTHPESTEEAPVLVPFTYGEAVENVPIALNLADGDQIVIADDGILVKSAVIKKPADLSPENVRYGKEIAGVTGEFLGDTEEVTVDLAMADGNQIITPSAEGKSISKVTITKPETLIPENIAKNVEIGGVVGTHEGGGNSSRNVFVKSGTYTATTSGAITVEHGLGTMPDIIIINALGVSSGTMMSIIGKSTELAALSSNNAQDSYIYNANILHVSFNSGVQQEDAYGYGAINMATPRTFVVGNSSGWVKHISGAEYSWTAIGGIVEHSDYFYITLALDGSNLIITGGSSAIDQILVYVNGEYAKTVDYVHGDEFVVDISDIDGYDTSPCTFSVEAVGENLDTLCPYRYYDTVSNGILAGGTCGDNAKWVLYDDGTMVISGEGAMDDYTAATEQPWYSYASNIKTLVIMDGITFVSGYAFENCSQIVKITIPESLIKYGPNTFSGCASIQTVYYEGTLKEWCEIYYKNIYSNPCNSGASLYIDGQLISDIVFTDEITAISFGAFYGCGSITSVVISGSITSLGNNAFRNCTALKTVKILDGVTSIGNYAFYVCTGLTDVIIGNGVTSIGYYAFHTCTALVNITMGNSIETINYRAFQGCSALTSFVIPATVTTIGDNTFYGCSSLTSVTFNDTTTWAFYSSSTATSGKTIGSTSLANKATAAKYLTRTYVAYWWKKT